MNKPVVKNLGLQPYLPIYQKMHNFTQLRDVNTQDEIWLLEHLPVFTQGKVGKSEHILQSTTIPIIQTDRGGQVTYHAPGQQIMYILVDLKRLNVSIRNTVSALENCVIQTLADYELIANARSDAPGVYIAGKKICSLGLHIQHGCTLHGLALNIDMDLTPFNNINPCGYAGLKMTQLSEYITNIKRDEICHKLTDYFMQQLYNDLS